MTNGNCAGITKLGKPCKIKAGEAGYCPLHNPERLAILQTAEEEALRIEEEKNQRLRSPRFSQRRGFKSRDVVQLEEMTKDLRTSIWNVLHRFIMHRYNGSQFDAITPFTPDDFIYSLWPIPLPLRAKKSLI